ncbi:MAG: DUF2058 family protein [Deltaproteobacteria bacterium]|nr:DUF2058 family protein [Deltaproteobacteria bacterium]
MQNLRDKLLKAGVVDKKAKKKADHKARLSRKAKKQQPKHKELEAKAEAQRKQRYEEEQQAKRSKDAELEAARRKEAEVRNAAVASQDEARREEENDLRARYRMRELLQATMFLPKTEGPVSFNFVARSGGIRSLQLSAALVRDLSEGRLGVCQLPGRERWGLVQRDVIEQVLAVEPALVRFFASDDFQLVEVVEPQIKSTLRSRYSTGRGGGGDRRDS